MLGSRLSVMAAVALTLLPLACAAQNRAPSADFELETVARGLEHPWAIAFLPDGHQLVTERAGRLRVIEDGELVEQPVSGVPELVVSGQGGLLDLQLHPDFKQNRVLFLSYAHRNGAGMTTRVARGEYRDRRLHNVTVIFEAEPRSSTSRHFAGRMAIPDDGYLYIAVGDRGRKDRAQDFSDDAGGVHRITLQGEVPDDNPFLDREDASPTLYTKGNRNIQGMTLHPETGAIWSHEHGPRGGDEINIIEAGTNYGWPEITYGIDYSGVPITDRTRKEGMAQPLHYWDPSIAPSGMAFYTGDDFPQWRGDLFVGALKMRKLVRLEFDGTEVTNEEDLLTGFDERIRDVAMGPDGHLWLLTDAPDGRVIRIVPAQ
ncbi:Glucose/arabinose dehydrogenase, beta-propeller fold [Marinobacter daqiaonensis]|uniref:Glucose/arabinose dehydrogenase, beta-propeller fold n=1 Tax=Marinobacter daqiaonensis TaxID=650891 RepID=A0A1I6J995_9GAMM|nr:PQQ-dependent sugar dehydrogenase [Marinobacter daqiaonensis]SFR75565.1 Glucose/arabinose dehydrogenase, beta-propeller fold [Marinobacter daqiaonensis]